MRRIIIALLMTLLMYVPLYGQDASVSGNLTGAGQSLTLNLDGFGAAAVQVTGTWSGTLEFEASVDGTNFVALTAHQPGSATTATATGANGAFEMPVSGYSKVRVRASALASGTAAVAIRASQTPSTGPLVVAGPIAVTGTFWQATQPVSGTVTANAGTGTFTVGDGGSSLTVDGTVTVTDGSGALNVIVDSMPSNDPSYTDATGSTVPANAAFVAGTDGTNTVALKVDSDGNLQVECLGGTCGGASPFEDNDAFTAGTTSVAVTGAFVDDTSPTAVSENSAGAPRMTPNRALHNVIRDAAGNERGANVTAGNALVVDGSAVTQPVSGTLALGDSFTGTEKIIPAAVFDASDLTWRTIIRTDTVPGSAADGIVVRVVGLTATAALADNTANPTLSQIQTFPMIWDGSSWDRWTGAVSGTVAVTDGAGALNVIVDSSALPTGAATAANQLPDGHNVTVDNAEGVSAVNIQDGGNTITVDGTVTVTDGAGALNVIVDSGTITAVTAITNALPAGTNDIGEVRVSDDSGNQIPSSTAAPAETARGLNVRPVHDDPCKTGLATPLPISVTADTQLVAAVGGQHVYVCSINLVVAAATNVAITAGTGAVCATSEAGVFGGSTAATGWNFAANGGIAFGNGDRTIGRTETAGDALCINVSAANQVSGSITYVQQ